MFYPPKGLCTAEYRRRSNCFNLCFNFVLGNVYWIFNLAKVIRLFGTFKMFYPPKGICIADYRRRSIFFYLCFNFVLGKVYWIFNLALVIRLFGTLKCYIPRRALLSRAQWVHFDSFHFVVV